MLNILIGVPTFDTVSTDFAMSLANMTKTVNAQVTLIDVRSPNLARSREVISEKCINGGFSHLLFLDSDMSFPSYTLSRLLGHQKDSVICNYSRRFEPEYPTIVPKERSTSDLVEVTGGGFGVCLLTAKCLESIKKPRFNNCWSDELQDYLPQDITFFKNIREQGFKTYMDKSLSKEIGHVGQKTYKLPIR